MKPYNNRSILLVSIFAFMSTIVSCRKFLMEHPQTELTTDNFFVDKASLEAGLVGMYSTARNIFGVYTNTPLFMTMVGTDVCMYKGTSGIRYDFDRYAFSPNTEALYTYWKIHYQIAAEANTIIAAAEKVASISRHDRDAITGEARFMRAYVYFRLVQAFGEVPVIKKPVNGEFDYGLPRMPIKDVYDFIIGDLDFAVQSLPTTKTNDGHANHWAAETLLGKVYLTMASAKETAMAKQIGKVDGYKDIEASVKDLYRKAREVLKDVKDNSGAGLLPVYGNVFKVENKNVNKESLFELQFSPTAPYGSSWSKQMGMIASGRINGNPVYYSNALAGAGVIVYVPKFHKYYSPYDVRGRWNLADSMIIIQNNEPQSLRYIWGNSYSPDKYNQVVLGRCGITKYRWGDSWKDESPYLYSNTPNNIIVLRYADVLLMFAEADYKVSGTISLEGLNAINEIRQRARGRHEDGSPVSEAETPGFDNFTVADINIDTILMERARELCFEFHRWFDLARTGKFEEFLEKTRPASDINIVNTATDFDPHKNYLFPIPQSELDLSTNKEHFKQNPGY